MQPTNDISSAVIYASNNKKFLEAIKKFFERVDNVVAMHNPVCMGGGTCCRFDLMPHRLYVTTGELGLLLTDTPEDIKRCEQKRCPYQRAAKCLARAKRPLGCRMFFCDKTTDEWSSQAYEKFHTELKALHLEFGEEYFYVEITSAIGFVWPDILNNQVEAWNEHKRY